MTKFVIITYLLSFFLISSAQTKIKKRKNIFNIELTTIDKSTKLNHGDYLKIDKVSKDTVVYGKYINGVKVGIWRYYSSDNDIYLKYDFDNNEVIEISETINSIDTFLVETNTEQFELKTVDRPPLMLDGEFELEKLAAISFEPDIFDLLEKEYEFIMAAIIIDKNGVQQEVSIEKELEESINEDVINAFKKIRFDWLPAIKEGERVRSKIHLCIHIYNNYEVLQNMIQHLPQNPYTRHVFYRYELTLPDN